MLRALFAAALLSAGTLVPPALARPVPACAGGGADAVVVRVTEDGVLVLKDGRSAVLEGVLLLQGGAADRAVQAMHRAALERVRAMVAGRQVTLALAPPGQDRYGRLRVQVLVPQGGDEGWVQEALLKAGLARVNIAPDRPQCAEALYAAEDLARASLTGLWASPAYAIRTPTGLAGRIGRFEIVEGRIADVRLKDGRAFLNFGSDWAHSLTAIIAPDDMAYFRAAGDDPRLYQGARVRLRGWVEKGRGPEIQIAGPEDIEVLPDQSPSE